MRDPAKSDWFKDLERASQPTRLHPDLRFFGYWSQVYKTPMLYFAAFALIIGGMLLWPLLAKAIYAMFSGAP